MNDKPANQEHYMIDLETMDTAITAVVVSIGVVKFTIENGVIDTLELKPSWTEGTYSPATIKWWLMQPEEARKAIVDTRHDLVSCLSGVKAYIGRNKQATVWSNGVDFDIAILTAKLEKFGLEPWDYRRNRCFKTIRKMFPVEHEFTGIQHHAVFDAIHQVETLIKINKTYGVRIL